MGTFREEFAADKSSWIFYILVIVGIVYWFSAPHEDAEWEKIKAQLPYHFAVVEGHGRVRCDYLMSRVNKGELLYREMAKACIRDELSDRPTPEQLEADRKFHEFFDPIFNNISSK